MRLLRVAGVDIDGDDLEVRAAELALQARRAPAFPCGRARTRSPTGSRARCGRASRRAVSSCAGAVLEGEIGDRLSGVRHRDRRDLAADQRRDPRARFPPPAWQAGSAAALPARRPIPYTPASPTATPAHAAQSDQGEPIHGGGGVRHDTARRAGPVIGVKTSVANAMSRATCHEQQDVGRPLCVRPGRRSWRRSTPRSISTGTCTGRTSPPARPTPRCSPNRASSRRTMPARSLTV